MIKIKCAICDNRSIKRRLYPATFKLRDLSRHTFSARRLPDRIHYQINKCLNCGLLFSSPIFDHSDIEKLYRESICDYYEQIPYLISTYSKLLNSIRSDLPKNPHVLEVGCGNGFFLENLQKSGILNVYGVEPSKEMRDKTVNSLKKRIVNDVFKAKQFSRDKFDLICCFHTLDHMINPKEFIRESHNLLKKKGFLLIVVHDAAGLSVKLFGERSPIFDIEHIYLFNKETLKKICEQRRFKTLHVGDVKNTYPVSYWLKMSGLPNNVKKMGMNFLSLLNLDKSDITFAGGNIYIIAQKL